MSAGRFLTTHVGSLPREQDLIDLIFTKEDAQAVDPATLEGRSRHSMWLWRQPPALIP
jgi:5-methyltetrahydropteroyltriglutamate--homocysteine methyltransferase